MTSRPFRMFVDSGNPDEPDPRAFASLAAALRAYGEYDDYYRRFVWIIELRDEGEAIVHMRDGQSEPLTQDQYNRSIML